ncbi:hypothetical protein CAC42_7716 [Sphaceloma murrayae]|uniref:RNA polymerase I-specific transcription initiation factor RRN6-like protein n=1 Tax=Sphaceloma murrayae TaxID=2082308 RepID=A0A2K1QXL3_9PEZI|nr:hypothetical protein CAC42_7716 [Sphaceloma murrayae]
MTDLYDDGPAYGHLGEPFYDSNNQQWIWKRSLDHVTYKCIGPPQTVIARPATRDESGADDKTSTRRTEQNRDPELYPTRSYTTLLDKISKHVTSALDRHDSLVGDLLAFGYVNDKLSHRIQPVAAFPTNTARTRLCIMRKHEQRQGWERDRHCHIVVPTIAGEHGLWDAPSPIQQITFCEGSSHYKGILAVRTHQATFLLRGRFSRSPIEGRSDEKASRLKISVLCVVPSGFAGNPQHSHVSINPWYASHFVTIDIAGMWNVWEANSRLDPNDVEEAQSIASGTLEDHSAHDDLSQSSAQHDGWLRALWVRDTDTLLLCSRTSLSVVDIPSNATVSASLESNVKRSVIWILDACSDHQHFDRIFILTTAFLYVARVEKLEPGKDGENQANVEVIHKIRHYRDHEDASLHLVISQDEDSCAVQIVSQLSSIVTCCTFCNTESSGGVVVSLAVDLTLLERPTGIQTRARLSSILQPARWDEIPGSGNDGKALAYHSRGVKFWTLTSMLKDLSIVSQLVAATPASYDGNVIFPPTWRSKMKITASRVGKSAFVVDDDSEEETSMQQESLLQGSSVPRSQSSFSVVNYERIYQHLAEHRAPHGSDMAAAVAKIKTALQASNASPSPMGTLLGFVDSDVNVSDLDEAADAFSRLVSGATGVEGQTLSQIAVLEQAAQPLSIKSIYREIVSLWLSPLSAEVPGRVRLAREQLARRTAATLCLASYTIQPPQPLPEVESQDGSSQNHGPSHFSSQPGSSQLRSSQAPLSHVQSSQPSPSRIDTYAATPASSSPSAALARLSRYTTVTIPAKPLPTSTPATLRILSHWNPASSPEDYNWLATQSHLAHQATEQEQLAHLSEKERSRLERKRQRLETRKRKEEERYASQLSQGIMAPTLGLSQGFSPLAQRGPQVMGGRSGALGQTGFGEMVIRSSPIREGRVQSSGGGDDQGQGAGDVGDGFQSSQLFSSQVPFSPMRSSQVEGRGALMGPPRKRAKRRTEGF